MALPRLNDTPKYDLVIPSTGQKVRYRPYLVKEEKVLMLALESKDTKAAIKSIVETIEACVQEPIDTSKLKIFDVEYMFTQIRSKSVGETSEIILKCKSCNVENEVSVKIDDINVTVPKVENIIQLTDTISLKLKWPNYKSLTDIEQNSTVTDQTFDMVIKCMDSILTEEEQMSFSDYSKEEILEFIDGLTQAQFNNVKNYISQMPRLRHDIDFNCVSCNTENKYTLEGIQDFF